MMNLPRFETYCDNTTAANALRFFMGDGVSVWFSYTTPVAFTRGDGVVHVRANSWGPTTGKHLNAIDGGDKAGRLASDEFEALLGAVFEGVGA